MTRPPVHSSSASAASPALLPVRAQVLTPLGWLQGTFNVPPNQSLMDFLSPGIQVLKFTRVRLPHVADNVPFVALRRESMHLIEPAIEEELIETPGSSGRTTPRSVGCLLPAGEVRGTLEVLVNVRVSDFLRQQASLLVLRGCVFTPYGAPAGSPEIRRLRIVLVNLAAAVGVVEWDTPA